MRKEKTKKDALTEKEEQEIYENEIELQSIADHMGSRTLIPWAILKSLLRNECWSKEKIKNFEAEVLSELQYLDRL